MGKDSKIEWTDHTFNPWWGCVKVSAGCANCYAEVQAHRYGDWWGENPRREFGVKHWNEPLKWDKRAAKEGKRKRVFCGSMCDIFESNDSVIEMRARLFALIEATQNLDWLLLTKRPENIDKMIDTETAWYSNGFPDNVWMGTSVEDQKTADGRIPHLLNIPSRIRFLSAEPLLGLINLTSIDRAEFGHGHVAGYSALHSHIGRPLLHWVIVGGESGAQARVLHPIHIRQIVDDCQDAKVPVFVKQLGTWWSKYRGMKDYKGSDPSEWDLLQNLTIREFPE